MYLGDKERCASRVFLSLLEDDESFATSLRHFMYGNLLYISYLSIMYDLPSQNKLIKGGINV